MSFAHLVGGLSCESPVSCWDDTPLAFLPGHIWPLGSRLNAGQRIFGQQWAQRLLTLLHVPVLVETPAGRSRGGFCFLVNLVRQNCRNLCNFVPFAEESTVSKAAGVLPSVPGVPEILRKKWHTVIHLFFWGIFILVWKFCLFFEFLKSIIDESEIHFFRNKSEIGKFRKGKIITNCPVVKSYAFSSTIFVMYFLRKRFTSEKFQVGIIFDFFFLILYQKVVPYESSQLISIKTFVMKKLRFVILSLCLLQISYNFCYKIIKIRNQFLLMQNLPNDIWDSKENIDLRLEVTGKMFYSRPYKDRINIKLWSEILFCCKSLTDFVDRNR